MKYQSAIVLMVAAVAVAVVSVVALGTDNNPFKALTRIACYHKTTYAGCQSCCLNIKHTFDFNGLNNRRGPCYCHEYIYSNSVPYIDPFVPQPSCKHIESGEEDCNLCCMHISKKGSLESGKCTCKA